MPLFGLSRVYTGELLSGFSQHEFDLSQRLPPELQSLLCSIGETFGQVILGHAVSGLIRALLG